MFKVCTFWHLTKHLQNQNRTCSSLIVKIVMIVCSTASNSSASLFYLSMTSNFLPTALLQWRRPALFCFCGKTSQHFNACIIHTLNEGQKKDNRGFWEIRPKSLRFPSLLADCSAAKVHSYTEKSSLGSRTWCQPGRCIKHIHFSLLSTAFFTH